MHSLEIASLTKGLAILKINIEKAYDQVYWPFLFSTLVQFGFHLRFVAWIRACIHNFNLVLLINGSPSHWILASRYLR